MIVGLAPEIFGYYFELNSILTKTLVSDAQRQQDSDLTEEEKLEGFHQYVTSGHYPIPMTKLVEGSNSLTELSLGTDKPLSDDEFLSQFRISHLSPRHQSTQRSK